MGIMSLEMSKDYSILIVDDEPVNLIALTNILEDKYTVFATTNGKDVMGIIKKKNPDIVLLDVMMPHVSGYDIIKEIKKNKQFSDIPVIFITALENEGDEEKGLKLGAVDYISKPISKAIVLARISNHLEFKHSRDLLKDKNKWLEIEINHRVHENSILQEVSLTTLVGLAEARDSDTGNHIIRTRFYCESILKYARPEYKLINNIDNNYIQLMSKAAQLHDIGKIGIPDSVLLKPGSLTPTEFDIMKTHCMIGANALSTSIENAIESIDGPSGNIHPMSLEFLELSKTISEYHHEKWNGKGYPKGLCKTAIPLPARVMAIADVFDALTTKRVYKKAIEPLEAMEYIISESGTHFDPDLISFFIEAKSDLLETYNRLGDTNVL